MPYSQALIILNIYISYRTNETVYLIPMEDISFPTLESANHLFVNVTSEVEPWAGVEQVYYVTVMT